MQIFAMAFGLFLWLGFWQPFHGGVHLALGLACWRYAPETHGYLAAGVGAIELLLLWKRVPCLLLGESGTVFTYTRRHHEESWNLVGSEKFDNTAFDSRNWLGAALHSFALAGAYEVCAHFDLFSIRLG